MSKDKSIIGVVGDSVFDCLSVLSKKVDTDDSNFSCYMLGMIGGTLLSAFSSPIGVPLLALSVVGGVVDIYLSDSSDGETLDIVDSVVLDVDENIDDAKYDIFKYLGCKNALKEYPKFVRMEEGGYVYNRPEGIKLADIRSYSEEIRLALNLKKMEVYLLDNKHMLIREYVDKIGCKQSYVNHKRDKNILMAYVGVFLNEKGELEPLAINFTKNNHMMVASTSGWGKSSLLRTMIVDLMLNYSEDELKFYFIDMKMTELVLFEDYKHCIGECITEHTDILPLLEKLKEELVERKRKIKSVKLNNIYQYNMKHSNDKMNYIILVIDELYEVVVGKSKEHKAIGELLALLLSQGRAFGMYFVLSTQHPSRKLIDASIQSNVAQRIGLKVQSETDSDVVFPGAGVPLHDIAYKGRGYFGGLDGTYTEFQSYYVGDPELGNEPDVIADLLKGYLKEDAKEYIEKSNVEKPKGVKSNKDIREMLYGDKNKKGGK